MIDFNIKEKLDTIFAYSGIVFGIVLSLVAYLMGTTYIDVGIMFFTACIIYLFVKKRLSGQPTFRSLEITSKWLNKRSTFLLLNSLFILVFSSSIVTLHFELYSRPLSYFILTVIACVLVSIEILILPEGKKKYDWLILSKIILIAISLRGSLYYEFPGLFASDPYAWVRVINFTLNEGKLLETILYYHFPVFNLILANTSLITGMDIKETMFMSVGMFEIFGVVYVYLIGRIVSNSKIGLIGALLLGISQFHIKMGVVIFQSSIGLGVYTLIIYLFFRKTQSRSAMFSSLLVFSVLFMIITHHLSDAILQIAILSMLLGQLFYINLYKEERISMSYNISIVMISIISMIAYWIYNGSWQFAHAVESTVDILRDVTSGEISVITVPVEYNWIITELKQSGILIFVFLAIIGCIYWISSRNKNVYKMVLVFGGMLLTVSVYAFIFSGFINTVLNRWFPFVYVLISVPAAQGVLLIINSFKGNINKIFALIIIISLFSTIMITTYTEDMEPSLYTKGKVLWRFMESDIIAANKMLSISDNALIMSDDRHNVYLSSVPSTNKIELISSEGNIVTKGGDYRGKIEVIREEYLNKYCSVIIKKEGIREVNYVVKFNGTDMVKERDKHCNRFYDSGQIKAYHV